MPRNTEHVSSRRRQSQRIMREKEAKKRRDQWRRKLRFASGTVLGILAVGGIFYGWYSGGLLHSINNTVDAAYQATARSGLAVTSLHIEGRKRTSMHEVMQAINIKKNDPIMQLSLSEIRDRLKEVPTIREAAVERALPGDLYIRIIEREPVAIWQHQGELSLVDDNGVIMDGMDMTPYRHLPLIVGDGAPQHVRELMDIFARSPEMMQEFASAIRVGDRRWNIRLQSDIEIKLPEVGAGDALGRLATLDKNEQLLQRTIKVIDLRVPDRVFIKLSPEIFTPSAVGAKET